MSLGQIIKEQRKLHNMTQEQLANLLSISPQAVSRWENNMAMPDIQQLIPLANIFHITTDTLLEVDSKNSEKRTKEVIDNRHKYGHPGEPSFDEKIEELREEVRRNPRSVELKDALLAALVSYVKGRIDDDIDPEIYREQVSVALDIIDSGRGQFSKETYQSVIVVASDKLKSADTITEMLKTASCIDLCSEVLKPLSLSGKEQADARFHLMFCCVNHAICTLYDLMKDNASDLSESQWDELKRAESLVSVMYGKRFSDCFISFEQLYKGITGAKSRGNNAEVKARLQDINRRLGICLSQGAVFSSLMTERDLSDVDGDLFLHDIDEYATKLLSYIFRDFSEETIAECFLDEVEELASFMEIKTSQLRMQAISQLNHVEDDEKAIIDFINTIHHINDNSEEGIQLKARKTELRKKVQKLKVQKAGV